MAELIGKGILEQFISGSLIQIQIQLLATKRCFSWLFGDLCKRSWSVSVDKSPHD